MMPSEILEFLITTGLISIFSVLIWLVTKFYKPKSLEIEFATPWKEAALAMGYAVGLCLIIAVLFSSSAKSPGVPIGTFRQFDVGKALSQWLLWMIISFIPISVIIKIRKQGFETLAVTRKNFNLSLATGLIVSLPTALFNATPGLLDRLFTFNALNAFIYYLAVGLGEELTFRGFLQLRCSTWLGETKGLILASAIMAIMHTPQRTFAMGLNPLQALVSAASIIPDSLLMGFLMLRTENIIGLRFYTPSPVGQATYNNQRPLT